MIAAWLLYATAIAALVGCAALVLEVVASYRRRRVRNIWLGALLCSLALPHLPQVWLPVGLAPEMVELKGPVFHLYWVRHVVMEHRGRDTVLLILWGTASAAALLWLLAMWLRIQLKSSHWRRGVLQGSPVLFARDLGPAVIGLAAPRVVMPEWISQLDVQSQQLALEHEREHARRRDPLATAMAALAVIIFPWNPALWWQLRRLRLAMELDCDAVVLDRGGELELYGALLLMVVGRARAGWKPVAGIATGRSQLEIRLRAMTAPSPRRGLLRTVSLAVASATLLLGATLLPNPVNRGCPDDPASATHP